MRKEYRTRALDLESLDDRLVPSVVDLTTPGAEAPAGAAIVSQTKIQPTGTGYVDAFVRIQGAASGGGSEQGYNTGARPLQFDENSSPKFTRNLLASAVPEVTVNGQGYREFLLGINQNSATPLLSLDEFRLYLSDTPNLTGYDPATQTLAGLAPVFDMGASPTGPVSVLLDARLTHGNGSGDMYMYVPDSAFAGADAGTYVYLYSKMGGLAGASANGGFEQWSVLKAGTGSLSGYVYGTDMSGVTTGLSGVSITLSGVDSKGNQVVQTVVTDASGFYSFTNLQAGVYSVTEDFVPAGYTSAPTQVGSIGGSISPTNPDSIVQIDLSAGQTGINYDFFNVQANLG